MASSGKKKTTFAKLARESKLRERRLDKQARKDARRQAAEADPDSLGELLPEPFNDLQPAAQLSDWPPEKTDR